MNRRSAAKHFKIAHRQSFLQPAGGWQADIRVSNTPEDWFYHCELTLDLPRDNRLKISGHFYHARIRACISSEWENEPDPFRLFTRGGDSQLLALGSVPIDPPAPATQAWRAPMIRLAREGSKFQTIVEDYYITTRAGHYAYSPPDPERASDDLTAVLAAAVRKRLKPPENETGVPLSSKNVNYTIRAFTHLGRQAGKTAAAFRGFGETMAKHVND